MHHFALNDLGLAVASPCSKWAPLQIGQRQRRQIAQASEANVGHGADGRGARGETEEEGRGGRTDLGASSSAFTGERATGRKLPYVPHPTARPPTAALARDPAGQPCRRGYAWPRPAHSPSPIHSQLFPHSIPSHPSHPSNLTICISGGRRKTSRKNPSYSSRRSFLVSCS